LIKASAGGGGKGMRVVENEAEFESQMNRAISEALNAFGDGFYENKYLLSSSISNHGRQPRNYFVLCSVSIQRRHQR
jgi:propionyl-CoA carboxylase alpha chain